MSIGMLLIILQIIGAMPQVIEFAKMVWELIKQIRDRRQRVAYRRELRRIVWDRRSIRKMSVDQTVTCMAELDDLALKVKDQLRKEGTHA